MMLDYWMILKDREPDHNLSDHELKAAIEHLGKALSLVGKVMDAMGSGVFDMMLLSEQCEESWNELNRCRVYTEQILYLEEAIIPAMGLVYDSKAMFDSLVAWKLGMTRHAALSIHSSLVGADAAIRLCLNEMLSWLEPVRAEDDQDEFPMIIDTDSSTDQYWGTDL